MLELPPVKFFPLYLKKFGACRIAKNHTQRRIEEEFNFEDRIVSDKKTKKRMSECSVYIHMGLP